MHPMICSFPNKTFYDGQLKNGVSASDRSLPFLWPQPNVPLIFLTPPGKSDRFKKRDDFIGEKCQGTGYYNTLECDQVLMMVDQLLDSGVNAQDIGVISPYEGQKQELRKLMNSRRKEYRNIEVDNVDAYQGREKDVIILSCVRSNTERNIGFLNDTRRLNVAITRAKRGLIVTGDPTTLCRNVVWRKFIDFCRKKNVLLDEQELKEQMERKRKGNKQEKSNENRNPNEGN